MVDSEDASDGEGRKVNLSASVCPTLLSTARNYEIWTSLWSLQPDGISIFQPANEIRPESNGGWRGGGGAVVLMRPV